MKYKEVDKKETLKATISMILCNNYYMYWYYYIPEKSPYTWYMYFAIGIIMQ